MEENIDPKLEEYRRFHKFEREKFLIEIKMMHEVAIEHNDKPRLKINKLDEATDLQLIKAHKFYWDKL